MTPDEAVAALDGIDHTDSERAHAVADEILLILVPDEVQAAYERLQDRCYWWVTA